MSGARTAEPGRAHQVGSPAAATAACSRISCVSKKLDHKALAQSLYISPLFQKNLKYAKKLNADKIFILSAKYGLLDLNDEIEPYNMTLNEMSNKEIKVWADNVLVTLGKVSQLDKDNFVFLAGNNYRKFLIAHLKNYEIPLQGLGIGKQLKWLTERINE